MRDAIDSDLDQCAALTTDRFLYDVPETAALRDMWADMIRRGGGIAGVIADAHASSRILYFFTVGFVTNERAERYQRLASPRVGYHMVKEHSAGGCPFLTLDEIADANAGEGVNTVVTHHGYTLRNDPSDERLRAATYELIRKYLIGWNMRTYTAEVFADNRARDGKQMGENLGHRVLSYSDEQLRGAGISPDRAPLVWLSTRQDVLTRPAGSYLALLFLSFSPPVYRFSLKEQRLLELALNGLTDEAICKTTRTSLTMVKARFRNIYDKVRAATTADSWVSTEPARAAGRTRGAEIRRHLLNMLRDHREELRPYAHSSQLVE